MVTDPEKKKKNKKKVLDFIFLTAIHVHSMIRILTMDGKETTIHGKLCNHKREERKKFNMTFS